MITAKHLEEAERDVVIVSEETEKIVRNEGYKDSRNEKMTRGAIKAAMERLLNRNRIVRSISWDYVLSVYSLCRWL